ncbi:MAG: methyltransferase domain-containing protein [Coleofasciculaceae cyanobacterium]
MQSPQFNRWVSRPWAIVRTSNDTRPTTVARFVNRQDAEDHLRVLQRYLRTSNAQFTIVFDLTADPNYWEKCYQENRTPWDLGKPAPAFHTLLETTKIKPGLTAVLGCGRGYDALLFAEYGFQVIGFDFSPTALTTAKYLAKTSRSSAQFLQRNIFDLPQEFHQDFDYIIEHNCFSAIPTDSRGDYIEIVKHLLKEKGELIGIFLTKNPTNSPPFASTPEEISNYFKPNFRLLQFEHISESEYLGRFRLQ